MKIWTENLQVEELIGPRCTYENLVEYINYNEQCRGRVTQKQREDMELTCNEIVEKALAK